MNFKSGIFSGKTLVSIIIYNNIKIYWDIAFNLWNISHIIYT